MTHLTDNDGDLYLGDSILLVRYPEGDCDTIKWPLRQGRDDEDKGRHDLASALYEASECGEFEGRTVLLPDGSKFNIDDNLA